jgi:hypothetical protein
MIGELNEASIAVSNKICIEKPAPVKHNIRNSKRAQVLFPNMTCYMVKARGQSK